MGSSFPRTPHGVLLVGHGTRELTGISEFYATAKVISWLIDDAMSPIQWGIIPCFLELAEPTIADGISQLAQRNVEQITVMPLLLFAAAHAKHDIPAAVAEAAARYPQLKIRQAAHLGCARSIVALSEQRFAESLQDRPQVPASETLHLMVGRGSRDPDATAEMHELARLRSEQGTAARVEVAFLAMAQPSLADALQAIPRNVYRRVVVQPHLLFDGLLLAELRETVEDFARARPDLECVLTERLRVSKLVADAVVQRVHAAQAG